MFQSSVAAREKVKLMLGLTGPSGAGKTLSSLFLAYGVAGDWKKVALADTENKSALYYAGELTGPWEHIDFPATMPQGYHPENWIKLIEYVEKKPHIDVLVMDSITHEWEGLGGCLELSESIGSNKYAAWRVVTPLHRAFLDKMRHSRLHIIATMRSKQDYVVETNEKGKSQPKKVGTKAVQREGTDYEFGIIFDIEMSHYASASKDRTGLFRSKGPFTVTPATGRELLSWANSGAEPVGETYVAADEQKRVFAKLCETHGKIDKAAMAALSERFLGRPVAEMETYIMEAIPGDYIPKSG